MAAPPPLPPTLSQDTTRGREAKVEAREAVEEALRNALDPAAVDGKSLPSRLPPGQPELECAGRGSGSLAPTRETSNEEDTALCRSRRSHMPDVVAAYRRSGPNLWLLLRYCRDQLHRQSHEDVLQLSELELFSDLRMLLRGVAMRRLPARRRPAVGNG